MRVRSTNRRNEPLCHKTYLRTCAPSEDLDQPAHSRSLIRIFSGRLLDSQGYKVSSCGQRILWSDCPGAQADSSFRLGADVRRNVLPRGSNLSFCDLRAAKGQEQPPHPHNLIRTFYFRLQNHKIMKNARTNS